MRGISSHRHFMMTFNQFVAIHLEGHESHCGRRPGISINHMIILLKEISPSYISSQGYMSSNLVITNHLRETGRNIPVTRDEAIKMSTKVSKVFKACPPSEDQPGPILLHIKKWLKSLTANNLDQTRAEGFKSKFTNAVLNDE